MVGAGLAVQALQHGLALRPHGHLHPTGPQQDCPARPGLGVSEGLPRGTESLRVVETRGDLAEPEGSILEL